MSRELDLLVPPLGRAVVAGDQAGAMQAAEVPVHEPVAGFGLLRSAVGQAEMPLGIIAPGM